MICVSMQTPTGYSIMSLLAYCGTTPVYSALSSGLVPAVKTRYQPFYLTTQLLSYDGIAQLALQTHPGQPQCFRRTVPDKFQSAAEPGSQFDTCNALHCESYPHFYGCCHNMSAGEHHGTADARSAPAGLSSPGRGPAQEWKEGWLWMEDLQEPGSIKLLSPF